MSNPYRALSDLHYWSRSVAGAPTGGLDPCVTEIKIGREEKVATMGSCFAQHISRQIQRSGLNYFVAEPAPEAMAVDDAAAHNYGVFSARYGNIYTTRQALQFFDRAFGVFFPAETVWPRDGGFVDPFRPQIQPRPFANAEEVAASAAEHLACVRDLFLTSDWLVFTLGLTEAWRSKVDGAIFPLAPGVAGGAFDATKHEFVNFSAGEVRDDLSELIRKVRVVNPGIKFILTVSPVPLIATYEPRHVLTSTVFSKSALRVAADEVERQFEGVTYFPSFEIITSPSEGGRYYEDDLRQVTDFGVKHVMRVFCRHFINQDSATETLNFVENYSISGTKASGIVCDEETIERARLESGLKPSQKPVLQIPAE